MKILSTRDIGTPLSSPKGTMWYLFDSTPSNWCKTDAHSTNFARSISTWEDLTTRFLAQFFPPGRTTEKNFIELNDLNEPMELRRNQGDDLMPTIEEGVVIGEFRARNDTRLIVKFLDILVILEDMDDYRDEGMGDVIFGEPFLNEVGINANQFEEMITIFKGSVVNIARR
ncbi:hypothetical protein Tco_0883547, partial [Tanacetum coccineum]